MTGHVEWLRYITLVKREKVGSQGNKRGLPTARRGAAAVGHYKTLRGWTMVIATGGKMNPRYRLSRVHCTSSRGGHGL